MGPHWLEQGGDGSQEQGGPRLSAPAPAPGLVLPQAPRPAPPSLVEPPARSNPEEAGGGGGGGALGVLGRSRRPAHLPGWRAPCDRPPLPGAERPAGARPATAGTGMAAAAAAAAAAGDAEAEAWCRGAVWRGGAGMLRVARELGGREKEGAGWRTGPSSAPAYPTSPPLLRSFLSPSRQTHIPPPLFPTLSFPPLSSPSSTPLLPAPRPPEAASGTLGLSWVQHEF